MNDANGRVIIILTTAEHIVSGVIAVNTDSGSMLLQSQVRWKIHAEKSSTVHRFHCTRTNFTRRTCWCLCLQLAARTSHRNSLLSAFNYKPFDAIRCPISSVIEREWLLTLWHSLSWTTKPQRMKRERNRWALVYDNCWCTAYSCPPSTWKEINAVARSPTLPIFWHLTCHCGFFKDTLSVRYLWP